MTGHRVCVIDGIAGNPAKVDGTVSRSGVARFELPGRLPGGYQLQFAIGPPGLGGLGGEVFWLPGTRDPSAADVVEIEPRRTAHYAISLEEPSARIRGQVVGSWREMGTWPPRVLLFNADSHLTMSIDGVDDTGEFLAELFVPEPVRILVDITGIERWIGGTSFEEATEFDPQRGEEISDVRLIESGLLLRIDDPTQQRHWEATVKLFDASTGTSAAVLEFYRGMRIDLVAMPNLTPGEYLLEIRPTTFLQTEWIPQWYDRATSMDTATPIVIAAEGEVVPVDVRLEKGGKIIGDVWMEGENAPWAAVVFVTSSDSQEILGKIDPRVYSLIRPFSYTAAGLPDGDYKVGAWPQFHGGHPAEPPEGTLWYPGTADWDSATILSIRDQAEMQGIDFHFRLDRDAQQ
jgi:hypothetical protein